MTVLIYILLVLMLGFLVTASALFLLLVLDCLIQGHDLATSRRATRALADAIQKHKPEAKIFYDLGCAHGTLSLRLKNILPRLEIYGLDNSAIRILFAKLKSKMLRHNIKFQKQDIFKADLRKADVVYSYLWYDLMPVLEEKLQKELRQSALVITNTSHFQHWQPIEKIVTYAKISGTPDFETLFVYCKK